MQNILPKLIDAFPFIHKRSATEADFHEYCDKHNIHVIFDHDISTGVYFLYLDESFIFINDKLRGAMLLYVMFHELAHHLFHVPSQSGFGVEFFSVHSKKKIHFEAEAVAALLLLPTVEIHVALQNIEYAQPELAALVGFRLDLWGKYRV